jgi:hypothetical protein
MKHYQLFKLGPSYSWNYLLHILSLIKKMKINTIKYKLYTYIITTKDTSLFIEGFQKASLLLC